MSLHTDSENRLLKMLRATNSDPINVATGPVLTTLDGSKLVAEIVDHRLRSLGWDYNRIAGSTLGGHAIATLQLAYHWRGLPHMGICCIDRPHNDMDPDELPPIYGEMSAGDRVIIVDAAMHSLLPSLTALRVVKKADAVVMGIFCLIWCPMPGEPDEPPETVEDIPFHAIFTQRDVFTMKVVNLAATG